MSEATYQKRMLHLRQIVLNVGTASSHGTSSLGVVLNVAGVIPARGQHVASHVASSIAAGASTLCEISSVWKLKAAGFGLS